MASERYVSGIDDPVSVLPVTVASPDGRIRFDVRLRSEDRLGYRVTLKGRPVIETSRLGIVVDGVNLGDGVLAGAIERGTHDERYRTRGVHAMAADRQETRIRRTIGYKETQGGQEANAAP